MYKSDELMSQSPMWGLQGRQGCHCLVCQWLQKQDRRYGNVRLSAAKQSHHSKGSNQETDLSFAFTALRTR